MIIIGNLWGFLGAPASKPNPAQASFAVASLDISDVQAVTDWGYHTKLAMQMIPERTYITGENLISSDDEAAIALWCRQVTENNLTVLMGVRNTTDGQGQLWYFARETCRLPAPHPTLEYAASVGIPGITGGLFPTPPTAPSSVLPNTGFLACFEGFSLYRWIQIGFGTNRHIITFSNDHWTEPLNLGRLRRKIARQFEQLYGINTAHAEAGKTMLEIRFAEERTPR